MTDHDLIEKAAVSAIAAAAEKLSVDPMRLARFLQGGRIADLLQSIGREEAMAAHRAEVARLNQEYMAFLEEEVRECRERLRSMGERPTD